MFPLNEQQQAIVNAVVNSVDNINVVARAGCGKTYVLVNGVVLAIVENKLGSVALTAFNKSAATEFEQRISKLADETGERGLYRVETGTMHSFGFRFWRKLVGGKIDVDGYKVMNIGRELYGNTPKDEFLMQAVKLVSLAKQSAFGVDEAREHWMLLIEHFDIEANGNAEVIIDMAIEMLERSNGMRSKIDFDDMIYLPVIKDIDVDQFDFVLIDEAQDTNVARRLLAFKMMKPNGRLIAVGDDKQAIYGFTGADSNSLELIRVALNSQVLPLSITYRCPKAVVAEANKLVPDLVAHETAPEGVVRTIPSVTFS